MKRIKNIATVYPEPVDENGHPAGKIVPAQQWFVV